MGGMDVIEEVGQVGEGRLFLGDGYGNDGAERAEPRAGAVVGAVREEVKVSVVDGGRPWEGMRG